ncbi:MAG TPA: OsmC family protein [Bacteroidia bacterium]|nr:OsmC family protein [Bacteroidia bacterium]HRS57993.1 OsmC family protein [Bacteroidia bacterium]HRU68552.1 OsmC family protein [Bacteroidia bacterium]
MKESIILNWDSGMAFSTEIDGHSIQVDAHPEHGGSGKGPRPKPLLLAALAGCTAMDVVSILNKMKVEMRDFKVEVIANQTEEHPKVYDRFKLVYHVFGENIPQEKVEKAVDLSQEKYCGVSAMLKKAAELTYEIQLHQD